MIIGDDERSADGVRHRDVQATLAAAPGGDAGRLATPATPTLAP